MLWHVVKCCDIWPNVVKCCKMMWNHQCHTISNDPASGLRRYSNWHPQIAAPRWSRSLLFTVDTSNRLNNRGTSWNTVRLCESEILPSGATGGSEPATAEQQSLTASAMKTNCSMETYETDTSHLVMVKWCKVYCVLVLRDKQAHCETSRAFF